MYLNCIHSFTENSKAIYVFSGAIVILGEKYFMQLS